MLVSREPFGQEFLKIGEREIGLGDGAREPTTATGTSPHFSSARPITATSAIAGCPARTFSTSAQ